jgi:WD40 repeat protein
MIKASPPDIDPTPSPPSQHHRDNPLTFDLLFGRQQSPSVTHQAISRRVCTAPSTLERFRLDGRLRGHVGCVNTVSFSDEGEFCVTGSDDTYLMVWDVASHQQRLRAMSGHQVREEEGRRGVKTRGRMRK